MSESNAAGSKISSRRSIVAGFPEGALLVFDLTPWRRMPLACSTSAHCARSPFVHGWCSLPNDGCATSRERMRLVVVVRLLNSRIGFQKPLLLRYGLWNGMPFFRSTWISGRSMNEQDARNITVLNVG